MSKCNKCDVELEDSVAIENTLVAGIPDFIGQEDTRVQTVHAGGSGKLINALKCPKCGKCFYKGDV